MQSILSKLDAQKKIVIEYKYLPFILIVFLTLLNGLFNSLAVELGLGLSYLTFLFPHADFMADLLKGALTYPGPEIPNFDNWNDLYKGYLLNNPYSLQIDEVTPRITNLHGTPLMVLMYVGFRALLSHVPLIFFFITCQLLWIAPLFIIINTFITDKRLKFLFIITSIINYPFLFLITRGHIPSGMVGACIMVSFFLVYKKKYPLIMIISLIVAINIRPNLLVLSILPFLSWTFWRASLYALLIVFLSVIVFILLFYFAHLAYQNYTPSNFIKALAIYHEIYVVQESGLAYGSSLLGAVKLISYIFNFSLPVAIVEKIIFLISLPFFLFLTLLAITQKIDKYEALLSLMCVASLITSVFGDYHMIAFLALLLIYTYEIASTDMNKSKFDSFLLICLCLLLAPKNYVFFYDVSLQTIINPAIMLTATLYIILKYRNHFHVKELVAQISLPSHN
jgi:hypothetical protein